MKKYGRLLTTVLLLLFSVSACGTAKFHAAVESGNVQEVNRLLAAGADVNSRTDRGVDRDMTPLMLAAISGSREVTEVLIAHGADIHAKNGAGFTPLHAAVYQGHREVAELLVSKGADVNARSNDGWTPLHNATWRFVRVTGSSPSSEADRVKMTDIVKLLLDKGADVNAKASNGTTPLILAAGSGQKALVGLLIDHGAEVNSKGFEGVGALYTAVVTDQVEVAEILIDHGAEVDAGTKSGFTPLSYAARAGSRDLTALLISHGADVNSKDNIGRTPLVWALSISAAASPAGQSRMRRELSARERAENQRALKTAKGQWHETAMLLVDHGADIVTADSQGNSPLYLAAIIGDTDLVEALIGHGAVLDDASAGETALHASIAERHGDVARLLINKGANVNLKNMSERTPLHFLAAFMDDRDLAELLISRGADINAVDKDGHTPLSFATKAGNKQVEEALRTRGAK
jgi:ankyrin repeat protein